MSGYLLDTDICVFLMKGKSAVKAKVDEAGIQNCFISEITVFELWYGIEKSESSWMLSNTLKTNEFLQAFSTRLIPISGTSRLFGLHKTRLRKLGHPVGDFDILIACTALSYDLTMVTANKRHFADYPNLLVENWM
jgi:tRNA(fMet)-specific endonuclease VapC